MSTSEPLPVLYPELDLPPLPEPETEEMQFDLPQVVYQDLETVETITYFYNWLWFHYEGPINVNEYSNLVNNYLLQLMAFIPFCAVFVTFVVILFMRKLNDFYLQSSLGFICVAMLTRIVQIIIFYLLWDDYNDNKDSIKVLEMKMSIFEYTLPVYFFQTVILAALFSAHTMYTTTQDILFPSRSLVLSATEGYDNADEQRRPMRRKKKFWILQTFIFVVLGIYVLISLQIHDNGDKKLTWPVWQKLIVVLCLLALYVVQIMALFVSIAVQRGLQSLRDSKPECKSIPKCPSSDLDYLAPEDHCTECQQMIAVQKERLPMIINFFLIVTVIQFSHTTCYTTQTILNLSSDGSNFQISTSLLFVELIIELLLCVTLCVALCQGHKRCCVSPSDSAVSLRANSAASSARQDTQVIEKQEE